MPPYGANLSVLRPNSGEFVMVIPARERSFLRRQSSGRNGTLYTGITSNLIKRIWEHRTEAVDGFTKEYGVKTLVWYELTENPEAAIAREKQIKAWKRGWKLKLIEERNPEWRDLYQDIIQ